MFYPLNYGDWFARVYGETSFSLTNLEKNRRLINEISLPASRRGRDYEPD